MQIYESTNIYWYVCAIFWLITRLDMMWNTQTGQKVKRAGWQISQGASWRLSAVIVATLRGLCVTDCCCWDFLSGVYRGWRNRHKPWSQLEFFGWKHLSQWMRSSDNRLILSLKGGKQVRSSSVQRYVRRQKSQQPAGVFSFETGGVKIKCCSVSVLTQRIEIGWISVRQVNVWALQRSQELMQMSHSKINKLVYFG